MLGRLVNFLACAALTLMAAGACWVIAILAVRAFLAAVGLR